MLSCFSCVQLCMTPMDCSPPEAPLSMGFSRQEYWSRLPCPPPEDLPNPETELTSPVYPALEVDSLPLAPPGQPRVSLLGVKSGVYNLLDM